MHRKQPNSRMCLVCGLANHAGLKAQFFELEGGDLLGVFTPQAAHQGYPGRLHGGIASAMLDETMGRAIMAGRDGDVWGVTLELTTRFKRPIPLGAELRVLGRITRQTRRGFEGAGEILLPDGTVACEGRGTYLKLPLEQIAGAGQSELDWGVVRSAGDPSEVEL